NLKYIFFLAVLFVVHVVGGVAFIVGVNKIKAFFGEHIRQLYQDYESAEHAANAIDFMQMKLMCCGINGTWNSNTIPASCKDKDGKQFTEGCAEKLNALIQNNLTPIVMSILAFAFFQLICMVLAARIGHAVKKTKLQTV
ncbi:hypothetical protein FBUS_08928, partial [Fasciolopsis buskii]